MKIVKIKIILMIVLLLSLIGFTSAKFVCGEVYTDGKIVPSWYDVKIYNYNDMNYFSSCQVSPQDFKYCCSIDETVLKNGTWIEGWNWKVGDIVKGEIVDYNSGFFTTPMYGVVGEEEYQVLPKVELREVVQVQEPNRNLIISQNYETYFKLNILDECDFYIEKNSSKELLCERGCDFEENFNVEYGKNNFEFLSVCGEYNFTKNISIQVVEKIDFEKNMGKKIKNKEGVRVSLEGNFSSVVESVEFREYIPVSFDVFDISKDGFLENSNSQYNVIVWNFSGENFYFDYKLRPTISGDFSVLTEVEGNFLDERNISVYNFVPPVKNKGSSSGGGYIFKPENFSKVNSNLPIIDSVDNMTVAIYSKKFMDKGAFDLLGINVSDKIYNRSLKFISSYLLENNLGENLDRFSFEYSMDGDFLKKNKFSNVEAYGVDQRGKFFRLNGKVVSDVDGNIKFVSTDNSYFGKISIYGVKESLSFWDKVIEWFWKIFR